MVRKKKKKEPLATETDPRYGNQWASLSRTIRKSAPVCCYCLAKPSEHVHHVQYVWDYETFFKLTATELKKLFESIKLLLDAVIPGIHVFPVCSDCHKTLHTQKNWKVHKTHNCLNHNTPNVVSKLKFGYGISSTTENIKTKKPRRVQTKASSRRK